MGGLGGMLATGLAFGAGSAVAHTAVRSMMGGSNEHEQGQVQEGQSGQGQTQQGQPQTQVCQNEMMNFSQCLQRNEDLSYCQNLGDMLKNCRKQNNLI